MQKARLVILTVAVAAAGAAGYIAMNMRPDVTVVQKEAQPQIKLQDILVATENLGVGTEVQGQMRWQAWPADAMADGYIKRSDRPDAPEELKGSTVRLRIFTGEPIREAKLIGKGQRFMSAQLAAGMRAIATQITTDTSAGGFILPDDYVDVIMVHEIEIQGKPKQYITETVLRNIRVLAIDQTIQEDEKGEKTKIGSTATLELTPEQAEVITVAQQMAARLTLALRSVQDAQEQTGPGAEYLVNSPGRNGNVKLIKSNTMVEIMGRK